MEDLRQQSPLFSLQVDDKGIQVLKSGSAWAKALAVLGFILAAMILLFGGMLYIELTRITAYNTYSKANYSRLALLYLGGTVLLACFFIVGSAFTLRFANRVAAAIRTNDTVYLNDGIGAIRNGMIFWAILFILFIGLLLLAIATWK